MAQLRTATAIAASSCITLLAYALPWLLAGLAAGEPAPDFVRAGAAADRAVHYLPPPPPSLLPAEAEPAQAVPERPADTAAAEPPPQPPPSTLAAPKGTVLAISPAPVPIPPSKAARTGDPRRRGGSLRSAIRRSPTAKKKRRQRCSKEWPEIRELADGSYEIDQSLVDHYTQNLETFLELGWSKPYQTDSGERGWYVSGFSCNSPLYAGGLRRGDVLLTVNGKKTRTWVQVYFLYQRLKSKEEFEIALLRKGEPVTLLVRLRDPEKEAAHERKRDKKRSREQRRAAR